jgi:DNA-binding transcriptional LysR family regulator
VIGHRLFDRDTRNVALTPAGQAFAQSARAVLQQVSAGIERARDIAIGDAGRLIIGFTPTTALRLLPRIVPPFRTTRPKVEVELLELMPAPLVEALGIGQIDLAIMRDPSPVADLVADVLQEEAYVAVLPAGHRLAQSDVFDLAGLADDPFVLFPRNEESQSVANVFALCAEAGFVPRGVQQVPGWQTAIAMVGSGMGVTILPESVDSLNLPGIVYRRIDSPIRSTIAAARRADDARSMLLAFVELAIAVMSA